MPSQSNTSGLWEKKTYISAVVSMLITGAVTFAVCAVQGDTLALGHSSAVSVLNGHTDSSTGLCLAGGK